MIDLLSVAIALGLLSTGWLLGRHARLKSAPRPIEPFCLCGHHYGTHDPETGSCGVDVKARFQERAGGWEKDVWRLCACVRYTGPQPVEQYWVPPAADMSIVTAPRHVEGGEQQ